MYERLTPRERRSYEDGTWTGWDASHGPRCGKCGCLQDNHQIRATKRGPTVGRCLVCGCSEYRDKP